MAEAATDKADEATAAPPEATEPPKRARGRPKGLPKTGGRQKKIADEKALLREAGAKALQAAIDILDGKKRWVMGPTGREYEAKPSFEQIDKTAKWVLAKRIPDLQSVATQITGAEGGPVQIEAPVSNRDLARSVLEILRTARIEDSAELPVIDGKQFDGVANERAVEHGAAGDADGKSAAAAAGDGYGFSAAGALAAAQYDRQTMKANRQAEMEMRPDERPPAGFQGGLPDASGLVAGERVMVKDEHDREIPGWLEYRYSLGKGDGRECFWLVDKHGTRVGSALGREVAEAKLAEFARTGKVTK